MLINKLLSLFPRYYLCLLSRILAEKSGESPFRLATFLLFMSKFICLLLEFVGKTYENRQPSVVLHILVFKLKVGCKI